MINADYLEEQLCFLGPWIETAGQSLITMYDPSSKLFPRELPARGAGSTTARSGIPATSTNRAFFALREYFRYLSEEDRGQNERDRVAEVLVGVARRLGTDPESLRQSSNGLNMFTDSHFLVTAALIPNLKRVVPRLRLDVELVRRHANHVAQKVQRKLVAWQGGKVDRQDEIHDFVTLHVVRSLDFFRQVFGPRPPRFDNALEARIRKDVLSLLANHAAGFSSKFDPNELLFSVALLNRFPTPDVPSLTVRSIQSIVDSQAPDGAWPTARPVSNQGRGLLHVASYEVALALTQLVIRKLSQNDTSLCEKCLEALFRSSRLVQKQFDVVSGRSGWCNDHGRRSGVLELWATAIVLTFLIHYRDAVRMLLQKTVLDRLKATPPPSSNSADVAWPDLIPASRSEAWVNFEALQGISDPTDDLKMTSALRERIARPVSQSWLHRPSNVSLLLYGPPGTRKTSLVARLAEALGWPFIVLSPPWFLRKGGLEGFETSAAEIFDDLMRLRRVVVLFDECEDFFKARTPDQKLESRTTGAFITAGMLPRLQALRDRRWMVFVLATNSSLEQLDKASTRPGRFDYKYEMGHPTLKAQIEYIRRRCRGTGLSTRLLEGALVEHQKRYGGSSVSPDKTVSFYVLDQVVERLKVKKLGASPAAVQRSLERLTLQEGPPSLV